MRKGYPKARRRREKIRFLVKFRIFWSHQRILDTPLGWGGSFAKIFPISSCFNLFFPIRRMLITKDKLTGFPGHRRGAFGPDPAGISLPAHLEHPLHRARLHSGTADAGWGSSVQIRAAAPVGQCMHSRCESHPFWPLGTQKYVNNRQR